MTKGTVNSVISNMVTLRVDGGLILPGMPEDPDLPGNGWK